MDKSGSELWIYGLIVGGFLLFNYVMQQLAKRARAQQEAARQQQAPADGDEIPEDVWGRAPAPDGDAPDENAWGRTPTQAEEEPENVWGRAPAPPHPAPPVPGPAAMMTVSLPMPRVEAPAVPLPTPPLPQQRRSATADRLFDTRQDLRRAIVLMTVLGPCRALEPPDQR